MAGEDVVLSGMRLAVVADIHGNLLALEAVLDDLRAQSPDLVVNLGDHLSGPLWARETADVLMAAREWVQIRGNHDRQLTEQSLEEMGLSDRAAALHLGDAEWAWLRSLQPSAVVDGDVLLCHGTPASDVEYLLEDVSRGETRLARDLAVPAGGLILCGHSHVPRFVRLSDTSLAANPGSVGLQAYTDYEHRFPHVMECGSPHARYLVLDQTKRGWQATFRTLEYDWDEATRRAEAGGREDWAFALRTGYALRKP
ncbi:MAG: metallophosphoesterase family protein [Bryobacteraceae bacterium]|nr:metallophosphoesterase family protein [Bryobacteraceae bacterium]